MQLETGLTGWFREDLLPLLSVAQSAMRIFGILCLVPSPEELWADVQRILSVFTSGIDGTLLYHSLDFLPALTHFVFIVSDFLWGLVQVVEVLGLFLCMSLYLYFISDCNWFWNNSVHIRHIVLDHTVKFRHIVCIFDACTVCIFDVSGFWWLCQQIKGYEEGLHWDIAVVCFYFHSLWNGSPSNHFLDSPPLSGIL